MKKYRKLLALALALALAVSVLAGCGISNSPSSAGESGGGSADVAPSSSTPPEEEAVADGVSKEISAIGDTMYVTGGSTARTTAAGSLTVGTMSAADGFNNVSATNDAAYLVYDRLFEKNTETGEAEPLLAESYEWIDNLTLKVKLREGVYFTSGNEMTAEDVLYSFQRHYIESSRFTRIFNALNLDESYVEDDYTVVFKYNYEYYDGLNIFSGASNAAIVEKAWCETATDDDWWGSPNGTGPFTVVENVNGSHITLKVKEDWWGFEQGLDVAYDTCTFYYYKEATTMLTDYSNGKLDMMFGFDVTTTELLAGGTVDNSVLYSRAIYTYVMYLPTQGVYADFFSDINVRLAVAHCLDLDSIAYMALGENYTPSTGYSSTGSGKWVYETDSYEYDVEKAKDYLAQSAYPNGYDLTVYLVQNSVTSPMAEAIQYYLGQIGINLEIQTLDLSSAVAKYAEGASAFMIKEVKSYDPSSYYERSASNSGGNMQLWIEDDALTEQIDKLQYSMDDAVRYEAMCYVYDYFHDNCWMINICDGNANYAYRDWVSNAIITDIGTLRNVRYVTFVE